MDANEILVEHLKRLYVSCRTHYVVCRPGQKYYVPKRQGTFFWLTDKVLLKHIQHEYAVGVYAGNDGSKFICFDVDDVCVETVNRVIAELEALGIPRNRIYVSFSGRKGYHVEVFFDAIVETGKLFNLYRRVIERGELDPRKVEFRPSQKMAIKLPLSVHGETGNICWYVDQTTLEPIEDAAYIATIEQVHVDDVIDALSPPPSDDGASENENGQASGDSFGRNAGMMLTAPGTRHEAMMKIAVYQRHAGATREENQNILEDWYAQQLSEMIDSSPEEVQKDIAKILDWVYSDRFTSTKTVERDTISITAGQMDTILSQWSRSSRRIIFLLLARTRFGKPRISAADISKATGISTRTVYDVIHKMIANGTITRKEGKRVQLPDHSYSAESCCYVVPHEAGLPHEMKIELTMRDLISDFDRTYHRALYALVRPSRIKSVLTAEEWSEYVDWAHVFDSDEDIVPKDRRIDLLGVPHELALPLKLVSPITAYLLDGRWLFPAYDMALILRYAAPSVVGGQCPHKEMWKIQVDRHILPNGLMSHQVLGKNFIPLEDVLDLVARSKAPEKDEIASYIESLREQEEKE